MKHPTDAELRAWIDGEAAREAADRIAGHVGRCRECAKRRDDLERERAETDRALNALDAPVPDVSVDDVLRRAEARDIGGRRTFSRAARAAVLAALVAAAAATAVVVPGSPVRDLVERLVGGSSEPVETVPDSVPPRWGTGAGVALVPGSKLEVAFAASQRAGTVELVSARGDTARVEVRGGAVRFRVDGGSILVQNEGAEASYRITVPATLETFDVRVADRTLYRREDGAVVVDRFEPVDGLRTASMAVTDSL